MLQKLLSTLMDLPYPLSLKEAQKKLTDTFLVVNNKLAYIYEIHDGSIHLSFKEGGLQALLASDVTSLEIWIPDTGIYKHIGKYHSLTKLPKRQWKKSFSYDFYKIYPMVQDNNPIYSFFEYGLVSENLWKTDKNIYYLSYKIGFIKDNELFLDNPTFKQEIIDLGKKDPSWHQLIKNF